MKLFIFTFALIISTTRGFNDFKIEVSKNVTENQIKNNSSCLDNVYSCLDSNKLLLPSRSNDADFDWPKTDSSVSQLCTELESSISCLQAKIKNDCSEDESGKEVAEQMLNAFELYHISVCPSATSQRSFLQETACYYDDNVTAKIVSVLKIFSKLITLGTPARCCSAVYFRGEMAKINAQNCQSEVTTFVNSLVKDVIGQNSEGCTVEDQSTTTCLNDLNDDLKQKFASIIVRNMSRQIALENEEDAEKDSDVEAGIVPQNNTLISRLHLGNIFNYAKLVRELEAQHPFIFYMLKAVWEYCVNNNCLQ